MTDDEEQPDPTVVNRRRAQGAASDLSRMGIDPRSLGLSDDELPADVPQSHEDDETPTASVHQLRPGMTAPVTEEEPDADVPPPEPVPAVDEPTLTPPVQPEARSRSTGALMRTIGRGLITPDAAEVAHGERELIDAVRRRQSDRRIIAVIAAKGGVGCTSIAVGIGTTFMAMRDDRAAVVDVQQGAPSLGTVFGAQEPRSVAEFTADTELVEPPVNAAGVGLVDGSTWQRALSRRDIGGVLDRLSANHTFHILDIGDDAGEGAHAALARADQAVIVSGAGQVGYAAMSTAVERVSDVNPQAAHRAVQVIVCPYEEAWKNAQRQLSGLERTGVAVIGPDRHLQTGHAFDAGLVNTQTRQALLRMCAAIAGAS